MFRVAEDYSSNRKGKRQYLNDVRTADFTEKLNAYSRTKVEVVRSMRGEGQETETLISEEALLFAKYLRNERKDWIPRICILKS
jgi:hypothetical protein